MNDDCEWCPVLAGDLRPGERLTCPRCGARLIHRGEPALARPKLAEMIASGALLSDLLADMALVAQARPLLAAPGFAPRPQESQSTGARPSATDRPDWLSDRHEWYWMGWQLNDRLNRIACTPSLARQAAVLEWLVARGGSERTRGHAVAGEVRAPKLAELIGLAFAGPEYRAAWAASAQRGDSGPRRVGASELGGLLLRGATAAWFGVSFDLSKSLDELQRAWALTG